MRLLFRRRLYKPIINVTDIRTIQAMVTTSDSKTLDTHLDKLEILHKSEHFIVVNKDFDVVINSNDPERLSIYRQLSYKYPELANEKLTHGFYVAHRLDYSTSGVYLIPVTKAAAKSAGKLFEHKQTKKYYLALVRGHVLNRNVFTIDYPIGKDSRPEFMGIRMCTPDYDYCQDPRDAITKCVLIETGYIDNQAVSKLLLSPKTGRRHQLRVHCKEIGHTIVGDYTYSDKTDTSQYRMFLHAMRLCLPSHLENIDIQTQDPFTEADARNNYVVENRFLSISEGMELF
eukprot:TRINITY_DN4118_c0_g1_i11.p1 TRINITY_DN4118_c0_g1~~TRINITY_DN4118_c0_g1_i11.p1  ORF type:complete len:287 (+),score=-3.80 TRINITY_DN4118_c0_g1_i11:83-943(+)